MNREEFLAKYWSYFLAIEEDFIKTLRYVELNEANYKTFSIEYVKQYQTICSELDTLFKELCLFYIGEESYKKEKRWNIEKYAGIILNNYPKVKEAQVVVKTYKGIKLRPYKEWTTAPKYQSPKWWTEYNSVKHERNENFLYANLENVINSLAALYVLEKKLLKIVCEESKNDYDIPDEDSNIFSIKGWETRMKSSKEFAYKIMDQ